MPRVAALVACRTSVMAAGTVLRRALATTEVPGRDNPHAHGL